MTGPETEQSINTFNFERDFPVGGSCAFLVVILTDQILIVKLRNVRRMESQLRKLRKEKLIHNF